MKPLHRGSWRYSGSNLPNVSYPIIQFTCGHCGCATGASPIMFHEIQVAMRNAADGYALECGGCARITFRDVQGDYQTPPPPMGKNLAKLPAEIETLYREVRAAATAGAYTAAVVAARTIIVYVAGEKGAAAGITFKAAIEYLSDKGHLAGGMKKHFERIKDEGNQAVHKLTLSTREDCERILASLHALLLLVYELEE